MIGMAWRVSLVALLLVLVAQARADGHEGEGEGDDMEGSHGCGWPTTPSACPVWNGQKYIHPESQLDYDISQQDVPCMAHPATCTFTGRLMCEPGMKTLDQLTVGNNQRSYAQLKPGSPAVCGHGNREFSFFASKGMDTSKVLLVFATGGMCWDAESCGNPMFRSMAIDALQGAELAPAVGAVFTNALQTTPSNLKGGIFSQEETNHFHDWSVVVIPDCTGDQGIGARSYTYDEGERTCITAHHHGGINTGLAIHWMLENFMEAEQVLVIGTGPNSDSQANGGHGIAFWSRYVQDKLPDANIRTVIDSSMGLFAPGWREAMEKDTWGVRSLKVPDAATNELEDEDDYLISEDHFNLAVDDMSYFYELTSAHYPKLAFMDVSSIDDPVQKKTFISTGGMDRDCCLDGCECGGEAIPRGVRGGRLDWTKTRKVQILRRNARMPSHYRSWISNSDDRFLLTDTTLFHTCPDSSCMGATTLHEAVWAFANSVNEVDQVGRVEMVSHTGATVTSLMFMNDGTHICDNCLAAVLDGVREGDKCNATMGEGENLFTVSEKYHTNWMALWSLNGDETLDVKVSNTVYRFAHEYVVQAGESMEEIVGKFGTTVPAVVDLNYNLITHIQNPARLKHGDVICIVPVFHRTMDRHGNPVCPSDRQRFLEGMRREGEQDDMMESDR